MNKSYFIMNDTKVQYLKEEHTGIDISWKDLYQNVSTNDLNSNYKFIIDLNSTYSLREDLRVFLPFCLFGTTLNVLKKNNGYLYLNVFIEQEREMEIKNKLTNVFCMPFYNGKFTVYVNYQILNICSTDIPVSYCPFIPFSEKTLNALFNTKISEIPNAEYLIKNGLQYVDLNMNSSEFADKLASSQLNNVPILATILDKISNCICDDKTDINIIFEKSYSVLSNDDYEVLCKYFSKVYKTSEINIAVKKIFLSQLFHEISERKLMSFLFKKEYEIHRHFVFMCAKYLNANFVPKKSSRENFCVFFDKYLCNQNLFTVLLSCAMYREFKQLRTNNSQAAKEFKDINKRAIIYGYGIKEIVENTIRHTELQVGVMFFRLHKNKTISDFAVSSNITKSDEKTNWVEFSTIDASLFGILNTYANKNGLKIQYNDIASLFEFNHYEKINRNSFSDDKTIKNILFLKGLKIFNNHINNSNGYFEMCSLHNNETVFYCSDYNNSDCFIEKCAFIGTEYKILFPAIDLSKSEYFNLFDYKDTQTNGRTIGINDNSFDSMKKMLQNKIDFIYLSFLPEQIFELYNSLLADNVEEKLTKFIKCSMNNFNYKSANVVFINMLSLNKVEQSVTEKIIMYVYLNLMLKKYAYIVFYNLSKDVCNSFFLNYISIIQKYSNYDNDINFNYPWLFLYDVSGIPYIAKDMNENKIIEYNNYFSMNRLFFNMNKRENKLKVSLTAQECNNVLLPIEVLKDGLSLEAPIFKSHLTTILNNGIETEGFGVLQNEHVKLGNKLHVSEFFQAELLFENGYYTNCMAYIVAKHIQKLTENEMRNLHLIGYQHYSEALIKKIKDLIQDTLKAEIEFSIYSDLEGIVCSPIKENSRVIIIIPISSTLKTFNKIVASLGNVSQDDVVCYTLIELRDKPLKSDDSITILEKEYGWEEINTEFTYIDIIRDMPSGKRLRIYYFSLISTEWMRSDYCEICRDNKYPLWETGKNALTLSTHNGLPYNTREESIFRITEHKDEYIILSKHIIQAHIKRGHSDFLFYVDTNALFISLNDISKDKFRLEISDKLKEKNSNNQFYVLLVPEHFSNISFVDWVCKQIFNNNAVVIRENFEDEFVSDFHLKYNFLKNSDNINYIFVDDCLNTGRTYIKAMSLIQGFSNINTSKPSIISLVNRLDFHNWRILKQITENIYSAFDYMDPIILEQSGECWVCSELECLNQLTNTSYQVKIQEYFADKSTLLKIDEIKEQTPIENIAKKNRKNYMPQRTQLINVIYKKIFCFNKDGNITNKNIEELKNILGVDNSNIICKNIIDDKNPDISYKINFIKIISMPFLSSFNIITHIANDVLVAEITNLLNKYSNIIPNQLQLSYLSCLIKKLATNNSNFILERENMLSLWALACRIKSCNEDYEHFCKSYAVAMKRLMYKDRTKSVQIIKCLVEFINCLLPEGFNDSSNFISKKYGCSFKPDEFFSEFIRLTLLEKEYIIDNALESYKQDVDRYKTVDSSILNNYYYYHFRNLCDVLKVSKYSKILANLNEPTGMITDEEYYINKIKSFFEVCAIPIKKYAIVSFSISNSGDSTRFVFSSKHSVITGSQGINNLNMLANHLLNDEKKSDSSEIPEFSGSFKFDINQTILWSKKIGIYILPLNKNCGTIIFANFFQNKTSKQIFTEQHILLYKLFGVWRNKFANYFKNKEVANENINNISPDHGSKTLENVLNKHKR